MQAGSLLVRWRTPLVTTTIRLHPLTVAGRQVIIHVSTAPGREIMIVDASDGQLLHEIAVSPSGRNGGFLSSHTTVINGRAVLIVADEFAGHLSQWDIENGTRRTGDLRPTKRLFGQDARLTGVASYLRDGRLVLLVAGSDGAVRSCDPTTGKEVAPRLQHTSEVRALTTYTVGTNQYLACGDIEGTLTRWDLDTGKLVGARQKAHLGRIRQVVAYELADSVCLATGGLDQTVRLWDAVSGDPFGAMMIQLDNTLGVCVYSAGDAVEIGVASDRLYRYDGQSGVRLGQPVDGWEDACWAVCPGERDGRTVLYAADEQGIWYFGADAFTDPETDGSTPTESKG